MLRMPPSRNLGLLHHDNLAISVAVTSPRSSSCVEQK
jgi:hypothetical protein